MPVAIPGLPRGSSIVDLIGNTPMVRLSGFEAGLRSVELYAKAEWKNPGGSVKDRPAARMLADGERAGALTRGKDHPRRHVREHRHRLRDDWRGARVPCAAVRARERDAGAQTDSAGVRGGDRLHRSDGRVRRRDPARQGDVCRRARTCTSTRTSTTTPATGGRTTTPLPRKIIEQTSGRITHFVAGLGTSGTFVGAGRRLREFNPSIRLISVQPDSPLHGLEGLKHMETAIVPGIYDPALADEDIRVGHRGGIRPDPSAGRGAASSSGFRAARTWRAHCAWPAATSNAVVVVVFCDGGEKYLSERFWDEEPRRRGQTLMALALQPGVADAIRRHGAETYPNECCGALIGREGVVTAPIALPNTTEEGPRRRFLVRPDDYRQAEKQARHAGGDLLGFYHSHPDHPARPSQYRSRSRVAVFLVHHRFRAGGRARGHDVLAPA